MTRGQPLAWYLFERVFLLQARMPYIFSAGRGFWHLVAAVATAGLFLQLPHQAQAQTYNFQIGYTQCYSCGAGTCSDPVVFRFVVLIKRRCH